MAGLKKKEQKALKLFKERAMAAFSDKIEAIKLFGSKARAEALKIFDLDVVVVFKNGYWRDRRLIRSIAMDREKVL